MRPNSLKLNIFYRLKSAYPEWVHKGELGRLAVNEWGFENENMGRRCRELENEGLVEVRYTKSGRVKCAEYRYVPPIPPKKLSPEEQEAESQRILMEALK